MALVAAGADVHSQAEKGYGAGRCIAGQFSSGAFADGEGGERAGICRLINCAARAHAWLCRWTALHWASLEGHTETAKAVLAAGADVHRKTDTGYGAGGASGGISRVGRLPTVKAGEILALKIACAARAHALPCRWTALHWASLKGHTETAMALLAAGADVHCQTEKGYGAGRCIGQFASRPLAEGAGGGGGFGFQDCLRGAGACLAAWLCRWTALHYASQNGHTETAKALLAAGADVRCETEKGYGEGRCRALRFASGPFAEGEGGEGL
jgi:hypothetical protein